MLKNPKKNGYQSIHTTIKLANKKMLEVQVRTAEMDEIAEEGKSRGLSGQLSDIFDLDVLTLNRRWRSPFNLRQQLIIQRSGKSWFESEGGPA